MPAKIGLMVWNVPNDGNVVNNMSHNYMHYLMVRGDNFFFTPQIWQPRGASIVLLWQSMNGLGTPVSATVITPRAGYPVGYNLHSPRPPTVVLAI